MFEPPYALLLDRSRRAVVLTIRGTLSLEDCLTDAMADPASLRELAAAWGFRRLYDAGLQLPGELGEGDAFAHSVWGLEP